MLIQIELKYLRSVAHILGYLLKTESSKENYGIGGKGHSKDPK